MTAPTPPRATPPSPVRWTRRAVNTGILAAAGTGLAPVRARAQATHTFVSTTQGLRDALHAGPAGHTISLAPGTYDPIQADTLPPDMTLQSADPAHPGRMAGLNLQAFRNLHISDLVFDYIYHPSHEAHREPFFFRDGQGLSIDRVLIAGDTAHSRSPAAINGRGFATGISILQCQGVTISQCVFRWLARGLSVHAAQDVIIRRNDMAQIRIDGMSFSRISGLLIENNILHDFWGAPGVGDHSDMIQFWSEGAQTPSRGITIRGNILNRGSGTPTQSIFMRNEMVDTGRAGLSMFYQNILIEQNVILNSHSHGITVGETHNLSIRNNTLIYMPRDEEEPTRTDFVPVINTRAASRQVEILRNLVFRIGAPADRPDWRLADNLAIQHHSRLRPNHYSAVFHPYPRGDLGALETYFYSQDGPAGSGRIGASRLAP